MPAPPAESEPATESAIAVMARLSADCAKDGSVALADGRKSREKLEQPGRDQRHGVGEEEDAGQNEKAAQHLLDGAEMPAEALHRDHERADGDRRGDEGDAEPERIDEEQADALAHGVLARGHGEDRAEHGSDARRPAEGEGKADDIGADQP